MCGLQLLPDMLLHPSLTHTTHPCGLCASAGHTGCRVPALAMSLSQRVKCTTTGAFHCLDMISRAWDLLSQRQPPICATLSASNPAL